MPTPEPQVIKPKDHSPHEIESLPELADHLVAGTLTGLTVQGLHLADVDLSGVDVLDTLFIGCDLSPVQVMSLVERGAHVVPRFPRIPYPTQPSHLYTADDLAEGFAAHGFEGMFDHVVYEHYRKHGGANPDLREALAQRVHDHGIENALAAETNYWISQQGPESIVGIMGGHDLRRDREEYEKVARLAAILSRAGRLIVTGGGPGAMEAANLGSYMATRSDAELLAALEILREEPDFRRSDRYTATAVKVREAFPPADVSWEKAGGLAIPTWLYGHEPANLFAAQIAKLFSNAVREETILRLSRGAIVFAEGNAGTVQEVFQATTMTFYEPTEASGPFIFLGRRYWTEELPVEAMLRPLLERTKTGDRSGLIRLTDDIDEVAGLILGRG